MKKTLLLATLVLTLLVFLVACGGSSTTTHSGVALTLNTTKANALINQTIQFTASAPADWSITEPNGGSITNEGLYTTPANTGTFHIVAKNRENPSQTATASVDVAAEFLSLQKFVGGSSQPYSVTPVLSKLQANGTLATAVLNDSTTGQPLDTNAYDIYLSSDGTRAVFTNLTRGTYDGEVSYFYDIAIAAANGDIGTSSAQVNITQLTHNDQNRNFYTMDLFPQLSPDGKSIIDTHIGLDPVSGMRTTGIGKMNIDGSNFQLIFERVDASTWMPTYSPDGGKIAVEMAQRLGDEEYDGIATMNADGSNVVQLTGLLDASNYSCWDGMPAFTSDGKKIVFARECWPDSGGTYTQLYSMNTDGTGITAIHGGPQGGFISCQPRTFANGSVVFSSNVDAPGTDAFDLYSILPDGTKLTRITNNNFYDGFSVYWMNYNETTAAARAYRSHSSVQQRLEHLKRLREHKAR